MKISSLLNSFSLGLGIGLAVLGLASLAPPAPSKFLRVSLDPDPATILRVEEGTPYTVPARHILVLKCIGDANGSSLSSIQIKIDGAPAVAAQMSGPSPAILGFPVTARAGSVVTVEETFSDPYTLSFAAGYLAEE